MQKAHYKNNLGIQELFAWIVENYDKKVNMPKLLNYVENNYGFGLHLKS